MIVKLDFSNGVIRDFYGVYFIFYLWFIVVFLIICKVYEGVYVRKLWKYI